MKKTTNGFSLVHPARGGGVQRKKFLKTYTLDQLTVSIANMYFPGGCSSSGIMLNEQSYHLANYAGEILPTILDNGVHFTVGRYAQQIETDPIRVYLYTTPAESDIPEVSLAIDQ